MSGISKKISFGVLILAATVSASFFYFSMAKEAILRSQSASVNNPANNRVNDKNKAKEESQEVKIIFLGDMMFDRYIRQVAMKRGNGFIFEKIGEELKKVDLVVGNLEGPMTSRDSVSIGTSQGEPKNYIFTFDPSWARTLYENNIRLVNLGNNHMLNQKPEGVDETKKFLDGVGVEYFGDIAGKNSNGMYVDMYVDPAPVSSTGDSKSEQSGYSRCGVNNYVIKDIKNHRIGLINYNQFSPGSRERTLGNIVEIKNKTDILVVFTHWGVEYADSPKENIKNLAHEFIDQGADLVIGTHPHVIQGKEEYKGKMIYFSLGNFIFDQYFDSRTQQGLVIEAAIKPGNEGMSFDEKRVRLKKSGQTEWK